MITLVLLLGLLVIVIASIVTFPTSCYECNGKGELSIDGVKTKCGICNGKGEL